ncbi:sensor histidine kinase [Sphingobacterium sp. BN32]|uniref:sensor histidine kinase n=1 Tax=Sphingobacterium sp. BN32 TaxID=3058432 RepID=UPI00265D5DF5|nr:histidine kinase [Sphingobacterium sp. BN32]WKK60394.1 histidine kinase [Sphingobacterium sp. BN32]
MVKFFDREVSLVKLQVITWLFVMALTFASYLQNADFGYALVFTIINMFSMLAVIYGNACFLLPKLYFKGRVFTYLLATVLLLGIICFIRVELRSYFHELYFRGEDQSTSFQVYASIMTSLIINYLFSFIFRLALDYFNVRKDQKRLKEYTSKVELDLLKAQVQPHFLFNTLNNIYYVAQRESPQSAQLIEKLANIMRYFVDEASKALVKLPIDIQFLKDYIDLERMRMLHPMQVDFEMNVVPNAVELPPMLIIPLVENVFKHGIDKRSKENYLSLKIESSDGKLKINVSNKVFEEKNEQQGGNGLKNLIARLDILYGKNYKFERTLTNNIFNANLELPL